MANLAAPTTLIIFGPTGDLMRKKLAPALWRLFLQGALPERFRIIGFGRRPFTAEAFRSHVAELLGDQKDETKLNAFLNLLDYRQGLIDGTADYQKLNKNLEAVDTRWGLCSNRLFYIAVPPELYETIFRNLAKSKLTEPCHDHEIATPSRTLAAGLAMTGETGWRRIAVEKPFGKNLKTAEKLDALLGKLFPEDEIYRIDHYLAKEMLQNILAFRFSNNLFESNWSNEAIEQIEIKLWEMSGVEDRGSFYDGVGALRDVGQNHLLQMLALVTMERPENFSAPAIRDKRAEILARLTVSSPADIKKTMFRAQYDGYQSISGVRPRSCTETYFKIRAFLDTPRWRGVPIIMESGKRLPEQRKEILVTFKHTTPCLCPPGHEHLKNTVRIRLEPAEGIAVHFWSKKPGAGFALEERTLDFLLRPEQTRTQYVEEYERLLLDCITGDQTLFVSTDEVKAMWRFIDPIVRAWEKNLVPLQYYKPDALPVIASEAKQSRLATASHEIATSPLAPLGAPRNDIVAAKTIALVGLGKMGMNMTLRLLEKGWRVVVWNRSLELVKEAERHGAEGAASLKELVEKLKAPRRVWIMLPSYVKTSEGKPAGSPVDEIIFGKNGLAAVLTKGDIIIDGGNSLYEDTIRRAKMLKRKNIEFIDVGVSGGPAGARSGACLMVGGKEKTYALLEPLFKDLATTNGYGYMGASGAGHFVKMVHNGIEYGMMQALAEGFSVMKKSPFKLDLTKIAELYNHGSVIESRLVEWLKEAYEKFGESLSGVSGSVAHTGEGEWTVTTAKKFKIPVAVIEGAFKFRIRSQKNPSYAGKILSTLRAQFGGHDSKSNIKKQSAK